MLGDVPGCIRRTAIHLAGILARERATTVRTAPTVSIHHNFASGKARIAVGTADQKAPRWVDDVLGLFLFCANIIHFVCRYETKRPRQQSCQGL